MMSTNSVTVRNPEGSPRSGMPAYWIFLPLLAASGYILFLGGMFANKWAMGLPLLVFVLGLIGPICRAIGKKRVAAVCAVVVV